MKRILPFILFSVVLSLIATRFVASARGEVIRRRFEEVRDTLVERVSEAAETATAPESFATEAEEILEAAG